MQPSTTIAIILAPLLGPVIWWFLLYPGKKLMRWVWRKMPYGKLRTLLLTDLTFPSSEKTRPNRSLEAQRTRRPSNRG